MFLTLRELFGFLPFNFCVIYFEVPAWLWYSVTEMLQQNTSICDEVVENEHGYRVQILVGAICCVIYRAAEIVYYTPWTAYAIFKIDVPYEMSKATLCSFVRQRFVMLLEFILLPLPIFILVVKIMEWCGSYVIYAFLLGTTIVEIAIIYIYPRLIVPLTENLMPLPEKLSELKKEIENQAEKVGFPMENLFMTESYDNDLHANAMVTSNMILVGRTLIKQHK